MPQIITAKPGMIMPLTPQQRWRAAERMAARLTELAWSGVWHGQNSNDPYFIRCKGQSRRGGFTALFTRDTYHHGSGWWKNPDYNSCLHLSLSFFDPVAALQGFHEPTPKDVPLTRHFLKLIFGSARRFLWAEPPYSLAGKQHGVWHYRVFVDQGWQPIKPRGEVYNKTWTEPNWLSYSDLKALETAQAAGSGVEIPLPNRTNRR